VVAERGYIEYDRNANNNFYKYRPYLKW